MSSRKEMEAMANLQQSTSSSVSESLAASISSSSAHAAPAALEAAPSTSPVDSIFEWPAALNHRSVAVDVSVLAGSAESGCADGAAVEEARFLCPEGLCQTDANTLMFADRFNNVVRVLHLSAGTVTTLAGCGANDEKASLVQDKGGEAVPAKSARVFSPSSVCVDPANASRLLIGSDEVQHCIRAFAPSVNGGTVSIIAGQATNAEPAKDDHEGAARWLAECVRESVPATEAVLSDVVCMIGAKLAGSDETLVYFTSTKTHVVRSYNPRTHEVCLVVGTGVRGLASDGCLADPFGLVVDSKGRLVISCLEGFQIMRFDPTAVSAARLEVLAGRFEQSGCVDGDGKSEALLGDVSGVAIDEHDTIYFCDIGAGAVRAITAAGQVYTVVYHRTNDGSASASFNFDSPSSILYDSFAAARGQPRLFVCDMHRISQVQLRHTPTGFAASDSAQTVNGSLNSAKPIEVDASPVAAALAALQSAMRACDVGAIDGVLSSPAAASAAAASQLHALCVDARQLIASIRSAQDAAITGLRAAVNARDLPALERALATAHACGDTWDGSSSKLAALIHAGAAHHGHRYGTFEYAVYSSAHITTLTAEARAIVAALHAAQDQLAASLRLALEKGDLVSLNHALSLVAGTSERSLSAHHELQALKLAVGAQIAALRAQQAEAVVALEQAIVARQSADLRAALLRASTAPESNQINALSAVAHVLLAEIVAAQSQAIAALRVAFAHHNLALLSGAVSVAQSVSPSPDVLAVLEPACALLAELTAAQRAAAAALRAALQSHRLEALERALIESHAAPVSAEIDKLAEDVRALIAHLRSIAQPVKQLQQQDDDADEVEQRKSNMSRFKKTVAPDTVQTFSAAPIEPAPVVAAANLVDTSSFARVTAIRIVAGAAEPDCVDGAVEAARFNSPEGVCQTDANTIFVADRFNSRIRRVDLAARTVATVAGCDTLDGAEVDARGPIEALQARLYSPSCVCIDPAGCSVGGANESGAVQLLTCTDEVQICIRRLALAAAGSSGPSTVTHVAGSLGWAVTQPDADNDAAANESWIRERTVPSCAADQALLADISSMIGAKLAGSDETLVYFTSMETNAVRSYNPRTHEVCLVVGTGVRGPASDGCLADPFGLVVDSKGRLVISCLEGFQIMRFDPTAVSAARLEVLAGRFEQSGCVDGDGKSEALLGDVSGVAIDEHDTIYFCDIGAGAVRAITAAGQVYTLLSADSGFSLKYPTAVAFDCRAAAAGAPCLWVTDHHRLIQISIVFCDCLPSGAETFRYGAQAAAAAAPVDTKPAAASTSEIPSSRPRHFAALPTHVEHDLELLLSFANARAAVATAAAQAPANQTAVVRPVTLQRVQSVVSSRSASPVSTPTAADAEVTATTAEPAHSYAGGRAAVTKVAVEQAPATQSSAAEADDMAASAADDDETIDDSDATVSDSVADDTASIASHTSRPDAALDADLLQAMERARQSLMEIDALEQARSAVAKRRAQLHLKMHASPTKSAQFVAERELLESKLAGPKASAPNGANPSAVAAAGNMMPLFPAESAPHLRARLLYRGRRTTKPLRFADPIAAREQAYLAKNSGPTPALKVVLNQQNGPLAAMASGNALGSAQSMGPLASLKSDTSADAATSANALMLTLASEPLDADRATVSASDSAYSGAEHSAADASAEALRALMISIANERDEPADDENAPVWTIAQIISHAASRLAGATPSTPRSAAARELARKNQVQEDLEQLPSAEPPRKIMTETTSESAPDAPLPMWRTAGVGVAVAEGAVLPEASEAATQPPVVDVPSTKAPVWTIAQIISHAASRLVGATPSAPTPLREPEQQQQQA